MASHLAGGHDRVADAEVSDAAPRPVETVETVELAAADVESVSSLDPRLAGDCTSFRVVSETIC